MSNYVYLNYQSDLFPVSNKLGSESFQSENNPLERTILQKIAAKDKTALKDCYETYKDLIWSLAKKFSDSDEDAEKAVLEIFRDIRNMPGNLNRPMVMRSDS